MRSPQHHLLEGFAAAAGLACAQLRAQAHDVRMELARLLVRRAQLVRIRVRARVRVRARARVRDRSAVASICATRLLRCCCSSTWLGFVFGFHLRPCTGGMYMCVHAPGVPVHAHTHAATCDQARCLCRTGAQPFDDASWGRSLWALARTGAPF